MTAIKSEQSIAWRRRFRITLNHGGNPVAGKFAPPGSFSDFENCLVGRAVVWVFGEPGFDVVHLRGELLLFGTDSRKIEISEFVFGTVLNHGFPMRQ